jgi:hypothetical protein
MRLAARIVQRASSCSRQRSRTGFPALPPSIALSPRRIPGARLPDEQPRINRKGNARDDLALSAGRPAPVRAAAGWAGRRLAGRITALLGRPGPWTLPRIRRYLGWPQLSMRTLYRRVRLVAIWRRPKLTARGDPDHDHVVAGTGRWGLSVALVWGPGSGCRATG